MQIKKMANEYGSYDFSFISEGMKVSMMQTGDDHTFIARYENIVPLSSLEFAIMESDNYEVYSLFLKLITRIISGNVMDWDLKRDDAEEKIAMEKCTSWYKSVVHEGVIIIMSDAYPIRCPNTLTITQEQGAIILKFDKVDGREMGEYKSKYDITINIRQSGSRIYDLAFPFKLLFRELQELEIDNVQEKKLSTNE